MGRLGCLTDLSVFITGRCGTARLATLDNASEVSWDRRLDDISACTITIPSDCDGATSLIEPWCHELHAFRNGEEVWVGVVTEVTYGYKQVVIEARDMLAWTSVRVPECPFSVMNMDIALVAQTVIKLALADDDPCLYEYLQVVLSGQNVSLEEPFEAFRSSAYEQLLTLTDLGLSFTTLGRRIIVGGENLFQQTVGLLTDDMILGEISLRKDGSLYATRAFTRYFNDDQAATCSANGATGVCLPPLAGAACPAVSELTEAQRVCHGVVERVIDVGEPIGFSTAQQAGDIYINSLIPRGGTTSVVPRILEFPPGTRLSPDTPIDINELVPGMLISVAITGLPIEIFQQMRLQEVTYTATTTDEEIGLTLSSLNSIQSGLEVS